MKQVPICVLVFVVVYLLLTTAFAAPATLDNLNTGSILLPFGKTTFHRPETTGATLDINIAAFNVRAFGQAKLRKQDAVEALIKIVRRYDVILIQEIRDNAGQAVEEFRSQLNQWNIYYNVNMSEPLGRTASYKERYAYLYRSRLTLTGIIQDNTFASFERPPFIAKFGSVEAQFEFALIGIHTKPMQAVSEINALDAVHKRVQTEMNTNNILILGDLNAACAYVKQNQLSSLVLRQPPYQWLIADNMDTTVSQSGCAYDRFVMTGNEFLNALVPNSAQVFYFDQTYSMTPNQAKSVSDHYPIELTIRLPIKVSSGNCRVQCRMKRNADSDSITCPKHCQTETSFAGWVISFYTWLVSF